MTTEHRKLATIMFTDMVGYSALTQKNEALALELLDEHRTILRGIFLKHGGREIETVGDGFFVEFPSALDGARCAVAIQQALADRNAPSAPERRIQIRIGLHLGDVVQRGEHVHGDGVNIAARIERLAAPGSICLSEDVARQIQNKIELPLRKLGKGELKNIQMPVDIYRLVLPGERRSPPFSERIAFSLRRRQTRRILAGVVVAVAVVVFLGSWAWQRSRSTDLTLPDKPSIAVLPFVNMSGQPEQEYFSDGITDDIITALTRFTKMSIISRNSTFAYKGKATDVREVGKKLGARYVVGGTVRRSRDRVRVTAQLIDTSTGTHVWAESYDRELKDLFAVQDEITQQIAGRVDVEVDRALLERARRGSPRDFNAYDLVLQARKNIYEHSEANHAESRELLERAIKLDDQFAPAHLELAWVYLDEFRYGWHGRPDPLGRALRAALRAVELDPNNGFAHWRLAKILFFRKDLAQFEFEMRRALALNPNHAETLADVGIHLVVLDRVDEAYDFAQRAIRLDPNFPSWVFFVHTEYFYRKQRYRESLGAALQIKMPEYYWAHFWRALNYAQLGEPDKARAEAAEVLRLKPDFAWLEEARLWNVAEGFSAHVVEGAEKAGLPLRRTGGR